MLFRSTDSALTEANSLVSEVEGEVPSLAVPSVAVPAVAVNARDVDLALNTANLVPALSTDSAVSGRIKLLRQTIMQSIGVEDRETLGNDLAEMADEYHEGWSSGSDEGEDD